MITHSDSHHTEMTVEGSYDNTQMTVEGSYDNTQTIVTHR